MRLDGTHFKTRGRHVIVGLGRTGLSCARYLQAQGKTCVVTDSRATPPELTAVQQVAPSAELRLGQFDLSVLEGAAGVIVSPGVSLREPIITSALERSLPVVGDIELFAQVVQAPVVAVTGTNGKSTVTTLLAQLAAAAGLRVAVGGNLGTPALDLLLEPVPDLYVLELSSFQLETTYSLQTRAATVLNVTADHMDRYDSVLDYAQAKARVFHHCAVAVVNDDDALVRAMPRQQQRVSRFSIQRDATTEFSVRTSGRDLTLLHNGQPLLNMSELKLTGVHNAANALAALALCEALGLDLPVCLPALRAFKGLSHRTEWVADVAGVRFINDSKGTNVGATLAAVAGMPAPVVLIAGGQGKGQDFTALANGLRGQVKHAVLLGEAAAQLEQVLQGVCSVAKVDSLPQAVQRAAQVAQTGDIVLLSPACASLDMFRDYAHRGAEFAAAVKALSA